MLVHSPVMSQMDMNDYTVMHYFNNSELGEGLRPPRADIKIFSPPLK